MPGPLTVLCLGGHFRPSGLVRRVGRLCSGAQSCSQGCCWLQGTGTRLRETGRPRRVLSSCTEMGRLLHGCRPWRPRGHMGRGSSRHCLKQDGAGAWICLLILAGQLSSDLRAHLLGRTWDLGPGTPSDHHWQGTVGDHGWLRSSQLSPRLAEGLPFLRSAAGLCRDVGDEAGTGVHALRRLQIGRAHV